jgi:hypothetical protein
VGVTLRMLVRLQNIETVMHDLFQYVGSPRFMRGLRSAKTSHKLKSHVSNALTYREKGVVCNNVKYVSNAF